MFSKNPITIDEQKCIGCSLCVEDCPSGYLYMQNEKAKTHEKGCIECGHCFAICPQKAITMNGYSTEDVVDVVPMSDIDSEVLLKAMKSRRTIRQFKKEPIEQDKIDKILEAGRYCPTAANAQNVSYTILGNQQNAIEAICINLFKRGQKILSPFVKIAKKIDIDQHFFFKGAPLVIVVSSKSEINGGLASSYMEIMAESMGLGVLYSGFFVLCSKVSRKIRKMLNLKKGHKVIACMVIGYPKVKYMRTVPRQALQSKAL